MTFDIFSRRRWPLLVAAVFASSLAACGGGGGSSGAGTPREEPPGEGQPPVREVRPLPTSHAALPAASCGAGTDLEGGRSYRVEMPSRVDGAAIVFQVFEPRTFDCLAKHPLILEGHGFAGSRQTVAGSGFSGPVAQLVEAGYAVISIDQRGHGESGGTVRVMTPDFEGQDLIQIVDWAEAHLDYL